MSSSDLFNCAKEITPSGGGGIIVTNSSFDGYRALGLKANGKARLLSRRGKDFTRRFASIAHALEALPTIP